MRICLVRQFKTCDPRSFGIYYNPIIKVMDNRNHKLMDGNIFSRVFSGEEQNQMLLYNPIAPLSKREIYIMESDNIYITKLSKISLFP